MIEVKDLIKVYEINGQCFNAVDNVSFAIKKGEFVSIVGHSGSGKTTLLNLICGLTTPDHGQVLIDGINIRSMDDNTLSEFRNKKISFIYQFSSLIPTLTSLENIMLPTAFGNFGKDIPEYARELLDMVGLKDRMDSYPSHLSGGQQRRVAIARSFINSPEIILADEPTGDLDEQTEVEIIQLFKKMNGEKGITFVIVTHSKDIAGRASRQLKMINGIISDI